MPANQALRATAPTTELSQMSGSAVVLLVIAVVLIAAWLMLPTDYPELTARPTRPTRSARRTRRHGPQHRAGRQTTHRTHRKVTKGQHR